MRPERWRSNRRDFLKRTTLAGVGFWIAEQRASASSWSANEKLNIAIIGAGGRGASNLQGVSSENIVALCDVDEQRAGRAFEQYPGAKKYHDFRKLLEEGQDIDAVVVSTPDHTHAAASVMAMKLGKHVYCEKPLTHSVYEARVMRKTAADYKVATQMGNGGHSGETVRRTVELVRSGIIGPVREVHCWTNRPIWPQEIDRPSDTPPVPPQLNWDLWLGPAPERPYHPAYLPFTWRGWWDFGTGALGDMACHVMDAAYWALESGYPRNVEAEVSALHPETAPNWSVIRYEFPARGELPPVRLTWYDGGKLPPAELFQGEPLPSERSSGSLLVGEKGTLISPHGGRGRGLTLVPKEAFADVKQPDSFLPRSQGHYQEWLDACRGGPQALSNFDYAALLTETVLLGNVAIRVGKKIEWDAENMRALNCPEAARYIQREYRRGWTL